MGGAHDAGCWSATAPVPRTSWRWPRPPSGRPCRALAAGRLAGAAPDTFAVEPLPPGSPLRQVDPERLILTPHAIGQSEAARRANLALAQQTLAALAAGTVPACVVNPPAIPRWKEPVHADGR